MYPVLFQNGPFTAGGLIGARLLLILEERVHQGAISVDKMRDCV